MIRLFPVKSAAVDDEDFLFSEQIQGKLFVIYDIELFRIQLGEDIKSRFGFYRGNSRNICKRFVDEFPLFVDTAAGNDIIFFV